MKFVSSLAASSLALIMIGSASADSPEIDLEPGYWNWSHHTTLAGIPFSEENTECLPPEQSQITLDRMAADLGQDCSVSNVTPLGSGYSFTLSCDGFYAGEASGTLRKLSDYQLQLQATGQVMLAGLAADFSFEANASHVGQCPME